MGVSSEGPTESDENNLNKEKELRILYTNADSLHNKMQDLKLLLSRLQHTPHVIDNTEVNNRSNSKSVSSVYNIPGYELYCTNLEDISRGILVILMPTYIHQ